MLEGFDIPDFPSGGKGPVNKLLMIAFWLTSLAAALFILITSQPINH